MRDIEFIKRNWLAIIISGIIPGLLFALFFKIIESLRGAKVYTLILNVDYIPFFKNYTYPESIEVLFHLIISVILTACLFLLFDKLRMTSRKNMFKYTIFINLAIGLFIYPTTMLSNRTPEITDLTALFYWLLGHVIYGYLLSIFIYKTKASKS